VGFAPHPDVVVFGHSHKPLDEHGDGIWWFNPGSAGPRRFEYRETLHWAGEPLKNFGSNIKPEDIAEIRASLPKPLATDENARALAEKTVGQSRQAYDRSKDAFEASVATFEKSFDAAGQGATAFNRKIIDIAQRNVDSGFDLAKSLASAKNLSQIVELQAAYWRKQFGALRGQADEVRALSTKMTAHATEPVKAHVTRSIGELRNVG